MGRKNKTGRAPQSCRLRANREVRRAQQVPVPKAFGIRRPLEPSLSTAILGKVRELQIEGDIPESVDIRTSLHVTLFPHRAFGKQILKGLVTGYNLGSMSTKLERSTGGSHAESVSAEMTGVNVYKGKIVNIGLASPELEEERKNIADVLGPLGVRGVRRADQEAALHMSIGQSRSGLSVTEQRHVQHVVHEELDRVHHQENPLPFEPWQVYPDLGYWQQ